MLRLATPLRSGLLSSAIRRHSACCGGEHKMSEAELKMSKLLTEGIDGCTRVEVHDVSSEYATNYNRHTTDYKIYTTNYNNHTTNYNRHTIN